jgi:hypothetical protein
MPFFALKATKAAAKHTKTVSFVALSKRLGKASLVQSNPRRQRTKSARVAVSDAQVGEIQSRRARVKVRWN